MKLKTLLYCFLLLSPLTTFTELIYQFEDTTQEKRFYSLISEIRCPKCTSGSIASSDAPVARDMKDKAHELIVTGSSDEEIKIYIAERFGNFSNYRPPMEGVNYFLWFGPFLFFGLLFSLFFFTKRL